CIDSSLSGLGAYRDKSGFIPDARKAESRSQSCNLNHCIKWIYCALCLKQNAILRHVRSQKIQRLFGLPEPMEKNILMDPENMAMGAIAMMDVGCLWPKTWSTILI